MEPPLGEKALEEGGKTKKITERIALARKNPVHASHLKKSRGLILTRASAPEKKVKGIPFWGGLQMRDEEEGFERRVGDRSVPPNVIQRGIWEREMGQTRT